MGLPTYCLVVTITEKVKRITEEMHLEFMVIMMMILMEIIKMVKLISLSIYFFHKKSLYFFPCSENEKVEKIMFFSPVESEHTGVDVNV